MRAGILRWMALAGATTVLSSCVYAGSYTYEPQRTEHYVSPTIEGASQRINLDEVEKAFFNTKGNDLNSWMSAFEKRVNEIYEGSDIVSIDATRATGKLNITGFVDKNKQPGFQDGDDKLFAMEQTGDVVNNQLPYRISDERGRAYHDGSYSLLNNPIVQGLVVGSLFNHFFGPRYYTPYSHVSVLRDYRNTFRATPKFGAQRVANQSFTHRFKQRAFGSGIRSNNSWGRSFTSGNTRTPSYGVGSSRGWGSSTRSWGGGSSFGSRRSWGGGFRRR
jgi:hypothetical protein